MTDRGVFHCTRCDYTTVDVFQIGCPECGGGVFLPVDESPEFHERRKPMSVVRCGNQPCPECGTDDLVERTRWRYGVHGNGTLDTVIVCRECGNKEYPGQRPPH